MKNKGFTLIELLAVISILAILVVIALPNVLKTFRNSKQNTFTSEVQSLIKGAESKFVSESILTASNTCFDSKTNPLDISGRENIVYKIKLSSKGKIIEMSVADDEYQLIANDSSGIKRSDIGNKFKITPLSNITITACDGSVIK